MNYFRFSGQANDDLDLVTDDLREESPRAAQQFVNLLEEKCEFYAPAPLLGIPRDDLAGNMRCFVVYSYLVFYRPSDDGRGIEIARVLHSAMNITPDLFTH